MIKIYIGNNVVYLSDKRSENWSTYSESIHLKKFRALVVREKSDLLQQIQELEELPLDNPCVIFHHTPRELKKMFFSFYQVLEAAGGLVKNPQGKVLMMFRRGKWDLPKGKVDKGETIREAAKREITEETGVSKLKIINPIKFMNGKQDSTYHSYMLQGKRVMKKTYWFEIVSDDQSPLIPQSEEGITEVGWYSKKQVKENLKNSYRSVAWVLEAVEMPLQPPSKVRLPTLKAHS